MQGKNVCVLIMIIATSFALGRSAFPVPANIEGNRPITNNSESIVLRDSSVSNLLWVLPPPQGKIGQTIENLTVTADVCETLRSVSSDIKDIVKDIGTARAEQRSALKAIAAISDSAADQMKAARSKYNQLTESIADSEAQLDDYYKKYGTRFGGNLRTVYQSNWNANINAIKNANPGFNVQGVSTKELRLYFSVPGSIQDGLDISAMPAVISYSVQGLKASELASNKIGMSDELAVDLSLTTLGACLVQYPKLFGTNLQPTFALSTVYQYPQMFAYKINASYNIWQIYRHIEESGSSGGLFSSSSWTKTLDENWGEAAFKIAWTEEDPENRLSSEKRLEIERTIKADLLANLADLAAMKIGSQLVTPANPGPHGASVIADGLMQACGPNPYCAGAAIAFKALDAIFGSSSTKAEYEKKLNLTATYALDSASARYVIYGTNFASKR